MQKNFFDLTQTLKPSIPSWDGCCGFKMHQTLDYDEGMRIHRLEVPNGIGTHMDAPCHFIPGGLSIADLPLEQLIGRGILIAVDDRA